MTKYLYLKLGVGNCLADYWLNTLSDIPNICGKPAAAIYFGTITTEKIRKLHYMSNKKKANQEFKELTNNSNFYQAENFIMAEYNVNNAPKNRAEKCKFITITGKKVYIYEPKSVVSDLEVGKYNMYDNNLDKLKEKDGRIKTIIEKKEKIFNYFSIETQFETELNKGDISEDLKSKFKGEGFPLPDNATIQKKEDEWVIPGINRVVIKKEDDKLKIKRIRHIPKIMLIKNLKIYEIADVPHVLASLPSSGFHTQGTCREIFKNKYWSALQAIEHVLSDEKIVVPEHRLIELLSPYELETLVFLILTNAGLFVPAWRGGTQKDTDIIARNLADDEIKIPPVKFEGKKGGKYDSKTFQVKKCKIPHKLVADYLVVGVVDSKISEVEKKEKYYRDGRVLDAEWLLKQIKSEKQQETKGWLINSLDWVKDIPI